MKKNISDIISPLAPMDTDDLDTEQLKKELYTLRYIIKQLPGHIYWKGIDGTYLGCNIKMANLLYKTTLKYLIGRKVHDLVNETLADFTHKIDAGVMSSNQAISLEEEAIDINSAPAIYLTEKAPLHDVQGNVIGMLGVSFDVTEKKRNDQALKEAKEKAETMNTAALQVAHDIRSPLAAIMMLTEACVDIPEAQRLCLRDRIQMDTCKIAPGIYQYTAVDDCSRWRVLEIYNRRTANNTLQFLELLIEQFPFAIQRIQTDRGLEFFAEKVQKKLMSLNIKFRPNKPGSPHLNGKVERSQKTDLEEFYAVADLSNFEELRNELSCWQSFYNWQRPHGSLGGKTPSQIVSDLSDTTLLTDEIEKNYRLENERIQVANYQQDLAIRKLKRCL